MRYCYNNLWKLLIDRGMTRSELRDRVPFSTVTLAKMGKEQKISARILNKICQTLNCEVSDIVEFLTDDTVATSIDSRKKQNIQSSAKRMQKKRLLDTLLAEFAGHHYISKAHIAAMCEKQHREIREETLKRYLTEWSKKGLIYPAGRGWYSDLSQPFMPYTEPVTELSAFLKAAFPLLDGICWSTRQLSAFYHHLPGKFHAFVYIDRYSIRDIALALHEKYPEQAILENPGKHEASRFLVQENNIIIRPILHDDLNIAEKDPFLCIENILADFAIESDALSIVDGAEYSRILDNVASSARIKPGTIIRRLTRRNVKNQYTAILRKYFQKEGENPPMSTFLRN